MLFVFRNYDVQINEVGVKTMELCYHNSPLPTCGISDATTTLNETQAKTTTNKATKVQERYASLQHLLDNRRQIVLRRRTNFNNNIIINNNISDDFISYTTRDIQANIKKRKKQRLTPSVLQLHQGSLFKKKFIGYSPQQQLHRLLRTAGERREFLAWHLSSRAI